MNLELVYVTHNCFLAETPDRLLLFDLPAAPHIDAPGVALVRERLVDKRVFVFASHSHEDHFTPDVRQLARSAREATFIVSDDIAELHDAFNPEKQPGVVVVEPETWVTVADMDILGFESTDMGVGFFIRFQGQGLYFGGDVAEWAWPGQDEASSDFSRRHFQATLARLRDLAPAVAFTNADARLPNWTGALDLAREVRPRLLVPMHAFGEPERIWRFAQDLEQTGHGCPLFLYEKPGDVLRVTL